MSWECYKAGYVTTRKEHKCIYCRRKIPKKSKVFNWHGKYDGMFQNTYSCYSCTKYKKYLTDDDGRIGDFWDCIYYLFEELWIELEEIHGKVRTKLDSDYLIFEDTIGNVIHKQVYPILNEG